jgi:hypothetical protein
MSGSIKLKNLAGVGDQAMAQGKYAKKRLSGILKPISMHFNATQALKFPPAESPDLEITINCFTLIKCILLTTIFS